MDLASVKSFPDFPTDLARSFFEMAAWEDPCTAEHLTRVSKNVRQWIDPILYHTVILCTVTQLAQFHQSITLRNDSAFFARSVKILRLGNVKSAEFAVPVWVDRPPLETQMELVRNVFNACSGVRRLAFWLRLNEQGVLDEVTGVSGSRHLTHLSVLDVMPPPPFTHMYIKFLPPSLTHFHLDNKRYNIGETGGISHGTFLPHSPDSLTSVFPV
ncbi:hypothetical protein BDZ89DRAFT_1134869 [Hymenopellis radicata]|nr:hypothetical protein BDZ89DRAFT_1134869 [Hymenopellis radicata]